MTPFDVRGCYSVVLHVPRSIAFTAGRLGWKTAEPGYYIYTGRDARSVEKRIRRHASASKRRRWHIDYLTSQEGVQFVGSVIHRSPPESECSINQAIQRLPGAERVLPGFGASDCRSGCGRHLVRFRQEPRLESYAIS